jgi:hypothetical protein
MFNPNGGISQIRFASEWASAYWQLKESYEAVGQEFPEASIDLGEATYKPPSQFLLGDFENHSQAVHPNAEGFSQVDFISSQIYSLCEPFHRAALFVEAHALFSFQHVAGDKFKVSTNFPVDAVRAVFSDWLMRTQHASQPESEPRLILLVDERILFPAALESDVANPDVLASRIAVHRDDLKDAIKALGLSYPVYFISAQYGAFDDRSYFSLPNPGMIAWVQHRHRLSLGSCIYVKHVEKSVQTTSVRVPAGLSFISTNDFFAVTGYDSHSKVTKNSVVCKATSLPFLHEIKFLNYLPEPPKPLEPAELETDDDFIIQEETAGFGRVHSVCWPSNNYIAPVPAVVIPQPNSSQPAVAPPSVKAETPSKKRGLPTWMTQSTAPPEPSTAAESSPAPKRRKITEPASELQDQQNQLSFHPVKSEPAHRPVAKSNPPVADSSPAASQSRSQPKSVPPRLVHASFFSQEEDDDDAWISATGPPQPAAVAHESQSLQFMSQPDSQGDSIQIEEDDEVPAPTSYPIVAAPDEVDTDALVAPLDDQMLPKHQSRVNTQEFQSDDDLFAQVAREDEVEPERDQHPPSRKSSDSSLFAKSPGF